jgi:hypothetical protein
MSSARLGVMKRVKMVRSAKRSAMAAHHGQHAIHPGRRPHALGRKNALHIHAQVHGIGPYGSSKAVGHFGASSNVATATMEK